MKMPRTGRYTLGARAYDVVSGERAIYRAGRVAAIERLAPRPGDRVLDIGCGTGLNLPLLRAAVGRTGSVVGLDSSEDMLAIATAKVQRAGWRNVELVHGTADRLIELVEGPFDAVISTYAMSIIDGWRAVWDEAVGLLRPGGRAAIVDLSLPRGLGVIAWPVARLACWTGGADPHREPWRAVSELDDLSTSTHRAGHVVTAVGTRR